MKRIAVTTLLITAAALTLAACDPAPSPEPETPVEAVPVEDTEPPVTDLDECPRADKLPCN